MEIKQLEYFVAASEKGSFNKAAECLYTSQPNVSKVISGLEKELGRELFERNSKGIRLTPFGETMKEYAQNILKNILMINSTVSITPGEKLAVSTFPDSFTAKILIDFYEETSGKYNIEHFQGTAEEITDNVMKGLSEIGIVFIAENQIHSFQHILTHKKLKFCPFDTKELCIYAGRNNPLYERDSVSFSELPDLKFISGVRDYFSMEHHLETVSLGIIRREMLNNVICTTSEYVVLNALVNTDICSMGVNFFRDQYREYGVKTLAIDGCEPFITVGYVSGENQELSRPGMEFIEKFRQML
nr:LysR family transcriptional regulator [uncultured Mediterraneibacter sp.]